MPSVEINFFDSCREFKFESLEKAKSEYERIKKEILSGAKTFEISNDENSGFNLVQHVTSIELHK